MATASRPRSLNRARFLDLSPESCVVLFTCQHTGARRRLYLYVPAGGGYVRHGLRQICEGLSDTGATLHWAPSRRYPRLVDLIRREYRRMRRMEARDLAGSLT